MPMRPLTFAGELFFDKTWQSLPSGAQWLYPVIAMDPFTSAAGIGPILCRRWANHTSDLSTQDVEQYLGDLAAGGRAIVCERTEFVLLPRLLVDTGVAQSANRLARSLRAAKDCPSAYLRNELARAAAGLPARESELAVGLVEKRRNRGPIPAGVRAAVYRRDKWTCQDCGRLVLPRDVDERAGRKVPFDDANQLELDHIHPWSDGGSDDPSNLRALCSRCNRVKGVQRITEPTSAEVF